MGSRSHTVGFALGVMTALLGAAAPAGAADEVVAPGESIQAAIDDAQPGDTVRIAPGEFHENLTITTDDITLRGAGFGRNGTVLKPPAPTTASPCADAPASEAQGICVRGALPVDTGSPVRGVTIEDLTVEGFSGSGVYAFNAQDYTIARVRARGNLGYGIAGFVLSGAQVLDSIAIDNGDPGIYIGDSHDAQAAVVGNASIRNGIGGEGFGFLIRDSSHGVVVDNRATSNCVGFVFIDHGFNPAEPLDDWTADGNTANRNNGICPGSPEFPAFSGTGMLLGGTHDVEVTANNVFGNRPAIDSALAGGIVVASTTSLGGAEPTANTVSGNLAFHNRPADVVWDGTGHGNRFPRNLCEDSVPSPICDHPAAPHT
jgi:nitrous oxidase accessory protein NosD